MKVMNDFRLIFLVIATVAIFILLNGKYQFVNTNKSVLDREVSAYWHEWKSAGKDPACCMVDFDVVAPFKWDTLVYVNYNGVMSEASEQLAEYVNTNCTDAKDKCSAMKLHLLRGGRIVHEVDLYMVSDDAKGVYFCTRKDFIKRGRKDARFHLVREGEFMVLRDTTEEYVPSFSF